MITIAKRQKEKGRLYTDIGRLGIFYPRGATLGGSAQVNAMNMALPPDEEWQIIANLTGDDSWVPSNMRTYFEELERNLYMPENTPGHGFDGYIPVRTPTYLSTAASKYLLSDRSPVTTSPTSLPAGESLPS